MPDAKQEGHAALAALDRALEARPARDATDFTLVTEHLCAMRRQLTITAPDLLPDLNAVISCSLSGHFPLGKVPWSLIISARGSLQDLISKLNR